MPKGFIDTNVLVYQLDKRDPEKRDACRGLVRGLVTRGDAVISTQVLQRDRHAEYMAALALVRTPALCRSERGRTRALALTPDPSAERFDILLEAYAGHGKVSVGRGPQRYGIELMPEPSRTCKN